jgi:hypothetical protein
MELRKHIFGRKANPYLLLQLFSDDLRKFNKGFINFVGSVVKIREVLLLAQKINSACQQRLGIKSQRGCPVF